MSHPYHTPLMAPVAARLTTTITAMEIAPPPIDVVSPIGPRLLRTSGDVRLAIVAALTCPVEWGAALTLAAERWHGASWHECGPSNGLRRFVWKNGLDLDWAPAA